MATCWNGGTASVGCGVRSGVGRGSAVGGGVTVGVSIGVTIGFVHPVTRINTIPRRRRERNAFIQYHH
jgi:hypothetical protein